MKNLKMFMLPILFLRMATITNAQTSGWETGINLAGGVSDLIFANVKDQAKQEIKELDFVPRFFYSTGIYGRKFFKENYGLELGVSYSSFSFGPNVIRHNQEKIINNVRSNYVEIPVRFVYKKSIGKFAIGAFGGASAAFLVQSYLRSFSVYDGTKGTVHKDNIKPNSHSVNVFADAGILLRYDITEHFAIDTKPFFRVGALPVLKDTEDLFDPLLMAGGLNLATVWKF